MGGIIRFPWVIVIRRSTKRISSNIMYYACLAAAGLLTDFFFSPSIFCSQAAPNVLGTIFQQATNGGIALS